jgi:hypothetical protein
VALDFECVDIMRTSRYVPSGLSSSSDILQDTLNMYGIHTRCNAIFDNHIVVPQMKRRILISNTAEDLKQRFSYWVPRSSLVSFGEILMKTWASVNTGII